MFLYSRLSTRTPEVLATLLIFSLSSGVLGGILFYMDSTAPTVLADMTSQVPIDMQVSFSYPFYFQDNTTVEDVRTIVDEQDYVVNTEIVTLAQFYDWSEEDYIYSRKAFLGVNQTALETFPAAIEFDSGSNDFDDNSCIVEKSTFMRYGLEIGDNFTFSFDLWDENYTMVLVERDFVVVGTFTSHIYMHSPIWGQPETTYLQMITTQSAVQTMFDILPPDEYEGLTDRIWVGFDKESILETDAQLMIESLDSVKKRIEQATLPYALIGYNDFQLLEAVNEFALWSISVRSIALAFSLPSVIMGIMLIQYNTKLLSDEQRRDVGTLKTRGASGFQAFNWVMSSAIVTGIIGSLGAIATGILSAFVSGSVRELLVFLPEQLEGFTLLLQPIAIIVVFLFSFLAGIIITLPGAIKALIMTPTEAHGVLEGEVLSEVEKMGSPSIDIIALAVAAFLLGPMMSFAAIYGLNAVGLIIVPLFALLLFSFSRILARPTSRIKSWVLSRFHGRSVVVGSRLISRNVTMFKKSETMGPCSSPWYFLQDSLPQCPLQQATLT